MGRSACGSNSSRLLPHLSRLLSGAACSRSDKRFLTAAVVFKVSTLGTDRNRRQLLDCGICHCLWALSTVFTRISQRSVAGGHCHGYVSSASAASGPERSSTSKEGRKGRTGLSAVVISPTSRETQEDPSVAHSTHSPSLSGRRGGHSYVPVPGCWKWCGVTKPSLSCGKR